MSNLERLARAEGLTPTDVCIELVELAKGVPADQSIVEIGVYKAKTLCYLAHGARHGNMPRVYGIDPWDLPGKRPPDRLQFTSPATKRAAQLTVRQQGMGRYVTLIQGFSVDEARWWDRQPVGLLFIDGDHSYDAVRADLLAWASSLAPGAVVAFDDYSGSHNPEVKQAVDDLFEEGVLSPITLLHDRLAVTSLTSTAPVEQWLPDLISDEIPAKAEPEFAPADEEQESQPEPDAPAEEDEPEQAGSSAAAEESETESDGQPVDLGQDAPAEEPTPEPEPETQPAPEPPPRAGAGSGAGPWRDYAIQVTGSPASRWEFMNRNEIIATLEREGHKVA